MLSIATICLTPAFGQLSDKTGLKKDFTINTDGYEFEVETVANFEIEDVQFSKDDKKLTFDISSQLENNLAEIQIPINLINGNFTVFLNGEEIFPQIRKNDRISFIVLEFEGKGQNILEIIGTTYLPEFSALTLLVMSAAFATVVLSQKFKKS